MEQDFYKHRLQNNFGLSVLIPEPKERDDVHRIIYEVLCLGNINPASKQCYLHIISSLQGQGAEAIILGCTEIALLVKQADTSMPLFDSTTDHAVAISLDEDSSLIENKTISS
ncbi:MAG: aspartate racemase [Cellvibrionaceae bacterium]|jgi:aspartate racemase